MFEFRFVCIIGPIGLTVWKVRVRHHLLLWDPKVANTYFGIYIVMVDYFNLTTIYESAKDKPITFTSCVIVNESGVAGGQAIYM